MPSDPKIGSYLMRYETGQLDPKVGFTPTMTDFQHEVGRQCHGCRPHDLLSGIYDRCAGVVASLPFPPRNYNALRDRSEPPRLRACSVTQTK